MTRQAALLLALGSVAAASAILSFGTWVLLRRGRRGKAKEPEGRSSAGPRSRGVAD